jgi:hypothetical protein
MELAIFWTASEVGILSLNLAAGKENQGTTLTML